MSAVLHTLKDEAMSDPLAPASLEREFGRLEARLTAVEDDLKELRRDVREIRDALTTIRGGWRLLALVIGASASLGAVASKLVPALLLR
jgi:septal ring factor EnvC (AmiA/AmiB activator)